MAAVDLKPQNALLEVFGVFLRLGAVAFGGPLAHLGMMEAEAVQRRQWVSAQRFAEGVAVCQALPGPMSTQLAIWLGYVRAGWFGGLLAGIGFILPAFCILLVLSVLYTRYGSVPSAQDVFYGVNAAVIAIILTTGWRLGRAAVPDVFTGVVLAAAFTATLMRVELVWILLVAGGLGLLRYGRQRRPPRAAIFLFSPLLALLANADQLLQLAWFFLKAGTFLYGGGFVIVAFIEQGIVGQGWLTRREFLDGVALGQITPGPILTTVTFIGYLVAGWAGAFVATIAVFLPSFLFIFAAAPNLARWRGAEGFQAFLKGVNPAVVGEIMASAWSLGYGQPHRGTPGAIHDLPTALLLVAAIFALGRWKLSVPWVIGGAAVVGLAIRVVSGEW